MKKYICLVFENISTVIKSCVTSAKKYNFKKILKSSVIDHQRSSDPKKISYKMHENENFSFLRYWKIRSLTTAYEKRLYPIQTTLQQVTNQL